MLDVRRLRVLLELSRQGTLAATAKALAFSPSAVSQQLSQLEREAGVVLLERHGRGVTLTDAAHELIARTQRIVDELDAAEAELSRRAGRVAGTVRVASFPTAVAALVVPAIDALRTAAPEVDVRVSEVDPPEGLQLLRAGAADALIAYDYEGLPPLRDAAMARRPLLVDPVCVALAKAHPLAAAGALDPRRLRDARWIAGLPGTAFGALVHAVCRRAGFEPQIAHHAREFGTQRALVAAGQGVALLPSLGAGAGDEIALVPLADGTARHVSELTRRGSEQRPAVAAVLQELERRAAQPAR